MDSGWILNQDGRDALDDRDEEVRDSGGWMVNRGGLRFALSPTSFDFPRPRERRQRIRRNSRNGGGCTMGVDGRVG